MFDLKSTLILSVYLPPLLVAPKPHKMPEIVFKTSQIKIILSILNTNNASGFNGKSLISILKASRTTQTYSPLLKPSGLLGFVTNT